jgi:hypothetical protein
MPLNHVFCQIKTYTKPTFINSIELTNGKQASNKGR